MRRAAVATTLSALIALSALASSVIAGPIAAAGAPSSDPAAAATLALANVNKGAGTCSLYNPAPNSLGGSSFESSCAGYKGLPEYWCADFAKWVWANSGLFVGGLTAAASSFVTSHAGIVHTDPSYVPQPGDAVVYDFDGVAYADHVGIVTSVNADGSVTTVNGDFSGSGSGATFARTSHVQIALIGAKHRSVGQTPGGVGMTITDYVTPRTEPAASPAASVDVNGIPNLFWRTSDGTLLHTYEIAGSWAAPEVLTTGVWGDPSPSGAPDAVYRTADGHLGRSWFDAGSWHSGQILPLGSVQMASDPVVAIDGSGIENVFFEGSDHSIWHEYLYRGVWFGPSSVGDGARSAPAAITTADGGLDVFFATAHHGLGHSSFEHGAWSWTTPLDVAGSTVNGAPSVTLSSDGVEHVVWRSAGATIFSSTLAAGSWAVPTQIGTAARSNPVALTSSSSLAVASKVVGQPAIQASLFDGARWTAGLSVAATQGVPGHPVLFSSADVVTVAWLTSGGRLLGAQLASGSFSAPTLLAAP